MCGDFNIHVDDPSSKQALEFKNMIQPYGLKQHVNSSTHKSGLTLDLMITRDADTLFENLNVQSRSL